MGKVLDNWKKMRTMLDVLAEKEWQFAWRVEMVSPRGFRYSGDGTQAPAAFLNAVGAWKEDVLPAAVREAKRFCERPKPIPKPKRAYRRLHLLTPELRAEMKRTYIKEYMRKYRSKDFNELENVATNGGYVSPEERSSSTCDGGI